MTAIHLAAKHGHTQMFDVLKAHVSLKVTSTKVSYWLHSNIAVLTLKLNLLCGPKY